MRSGGRKDLLQRGRRDAELVGRRSARDAVLRSAPYFERSSANQGLLRRRVRGGANSQSARDVQHLAQIRQAVGLRQAGRRRRRGDRTLRPDRPGDGWNAASCAGPRPCQGSILCALRLRLELLPHVLFPVGEYPKAEIWAIAGGTTHRFDDKPESQEICFVPDYDDLIFALREPPAGSRQLGPDR